MQKEGQEPVKYIVEARMGDRWVALGSPHLVIEKAMQVKEAALESTLYQDARILVINSRKQIVRILD